MRQEGRRLRLRPPLVPRHAPAAHRPVWRPPLKTRLEIRQRVVFQRPPIYDKVVEAVGPLPDVVVFSYGDIIYSPGGWTPTLDVFCHEGVHQLQQERMGGPEPWWERYLEDIPWRVEQEIEAYRAQVAFFRVVAQDRNAVARFQRELASALCGPMYGRVVDFPTAYKRIGRSA